MFLKGKVVSLVLDYLEKLLPIQSYRLEGGVLKPKKMGSTIFQRGDQQKSFAQFVEEGFLTGTLSITIEGVAIPVFIVVRIGLFRSDAFAKLLQELAEGNPKHIEWSNFKYHARKVAGLRNPRQLIEPNEQLWLHFKEDVFWTLHEDILHELTVLIQGKR